MSRSTALNTIGNPVRFGSVDPDNRIYLSAGIESLASEVDRMVPESAMSSATDSDSEETVATSKAVKDAIQAANDYADGKLSSVYTPKGSVQTYADLSGKEATANPGDVWDVADTGMNYSWTGEKWDELGPILSNIQMKLTAGAGISVDNDEVAIKDGGVVTSMIGTKQVTGARIADNTLENRNFSDNSIAGGRIQANTITGAANDQDTATAAGKLAYSTVGTVNLRDSAVTEAKIASGAVSSSKLSSAVMRELNGKAADANVLHKTGAESAAGHKTFTAALTVGSRNSENAAGAQSVGEGSGVTASATNTHAEGTNTTASGYSAHAEGGASEASGRFSHAEGYGTKALPGQSDSAGHGTHAEGVNTQAGVGAERGTYSAGLNGVAAHAEGGGTGASGRASHAEGLRSLATGIGSHAEGIGTTANNDGEHAEGKYNVSNLNTIHSIGIGTGTAADGPTNPKNAVEVLNDGKVYVLGVGGYLGTSLTGATDLKTVIDGKAAGDELAGKLDKSGGTNAGSIAWSSPNLLGMTKADLKVNNGYLWLNNTAIVPNVATAPSIQLTLPTANGKLAITSEIPAVVAPSTASDSIGKAADAKETGEQLAEKVSKSGDTMTGALTVPSIRVGDTNTASGTNAIAEGSYNSAQGDYSHAEGSGNNALNKFEHAQGRFNASHIVQGSTFGNAGNTLSSIGFGVGGSASGSRRNAVETMQDGKTFIYGLGGYDGTNPDGARDLATVVNAIPAPSDETPAVDGAASAGSSAAYARGDHVHPTDTSRASVSDATLNGRGVDGSVFSEWSLNPTSYQGVLLGLKFIPGYAWIVVDIQTGNELNQWFAPKFESGNVTYLTWTEGGGGTKLVATREVIPGYVLGNQTEKPIPRLSDVPAVVAPSTDASATGKAADAKATGEQLAGKLDKAGGTMTGSIIFIPQNAAGASIAPYEDGIILRSGNGSTAIRVSYPASDNVVYLPARHGILALTSDIPSVVDFKEKLLTDWELVEGAQYVDEPWSLEYVTDQNGNSYWVCHDSGGDNFMVGKIGDRDAAEVSGADSYGQGPITFRRQTAQSLFDKAAAGATTLEELNRMVVALYRVFGFSQFQQ